MRLKAPGNPTLQGLPHFREFYLQKHRHILWVKNRERSLLTLEAGQGKVIILKCAQDTGLPSRKTISPEANQHGSDQTEKWRHPDQALSPLPAPWRRAHRAPEKVKAHGSPPRDRDLMTGREHPHPSSLHTLPHQHGITAEE